GPKPPASTIAASLWAAARTATSVTPSSARRKQIPSPPRGERVRERGLPSAYTVPVIFERLRRVTTPSPQRSPPLPGVEGRIAHDHNRYRHVRHHPCRARMACAETGAAAEPHRGAGAARTRAEDTSRPRRRRRGGRDGQLRHPRPHPRHRKL